MKVVVAGGGVIGLSIAWQCARHGASVTVVDPAPGTGASWVAGGMLAPAAEAYRGEEAVTALALDSLRRWPAFAAGLEADGATPTGFSEQGTLVVARDGDDAAVLHDLLACQLEQHLAVEHVSSREARRLEPALAPSIRGALWLPSDHQVDNRLLLGALLAAVRARGVELVDDTVVEAGASWVRTGTDAVRTADAVVVATGARVPTVLAGDRAVEVPVRPVKGQILRVRATASAVFPTRTVRGLDVYVIPRLHGEIAIGATSEEQGFDTTVTAGAVHQLLHDAWELLPGLAEAEFVEAVAGLRPGTPDNAPIVGRVPDGPVLALGHYRHGVLLAPVTAAAVAALVLGVAPRSGPAGASDGGFDPAADADRLAPEGALLAPFAPGRFVAVGR